MSEMAQAQVGLAPYEGAWTVAEARHLLRRTIYGPSPRMVAEARSLGLEGTLDLLLAPRPAPLPPVKHLPDPLGDDDFTRGALYDPDCAYGETWVDAPPFPSSQDLRPMERNRVLRYRRKSLDGWTFLRMTRASCNR